MLRINLKTLTANSQYLMCIVLKADFFAIFSTNKFFKNIIFRDPSGLLLPTVQGVINTWLNYFAIERQYQSEQSIKERTDGSNSALLHLSHLLSSLQIRYLFTLSIVIVRLSIFRFLRFYKCSYRKTFAFWNPKFFSTR